MQFTETPIHGAYLIEIIPHTDERGVFGRTVCVEEFRNHGLNGQMVQQSISWNPRKGTLRGLHYQAAPHEEEKLVRVTQGAIFDVIVDIRSGSSSYGQHYSVELTADNHSQLYIPKGVAHGFQTLIENTEVFYEMTVPFSSPSAKGIRWDDPGLGISWPDMNMTSCVECISKKDMAWPSLVDRERN